MYLVATLATSKGAKKRICPAFLILSNVCSCRGVTANASPAVNTMWSTLPVCSNSFSMFLSTSSVLRSQVNPRILSEAEGYNFLRCEMVDSMEVVREEETVTLAEDSRAPSATARPMPLRDLRVSTFYNGQVLEWRLMQDIIFKRKLF